MGTCASGVCCSSKIYSKEEAPTLIKSFSPPSDSPSWAYVYGFAIDPTNRLLLAGWTTSPYYKLYDLETLEEVGSFDSKELAHTPAFSCLFLSDSACAVSSSHKVEIFSFKREDPPKEKNGESIKISDCAQIKTLPLDQTISAYPREHTIRSLNSVYMNNNNNSAQLVLASHKESCLSFWKTPSKNQLYDENQYHQVGFLELMKTYNFHAKFCRAKFVNSCSSFCSNSENSAHFVATYHFGFCLFNVSWSEKEQNQEVNIELLRKIELSDSVDQSGFYSIDVARHFVVAHAAYGDFGYLYDLNNFRVVSELKAATGSQRNMPAIKISEDADVVVVGTRVGNIHFFSQESNWKEVLFQWWEPAIDFGGKVFDIHLCSDRQVVFTGGTSHNSVDSTPMKIFHVPILANRWKRRRIVFLLQIFCGLPKTKQMLDLYRVRGGIALFL